MSRQSFPTANPLPRRWLYFVSALAFVVGVMGCADTLVQQARENVALENEVADWLLLVHDGESAREFKRHYGDMESRSKVLKARIDELKKQANISNNATAEAAHENYKGELDNVLKSGADASARKSKEITRLQALAASLTGADAKDVLEVVGLAQKSITGH